MKCVNCGNEVHEHALFCSKCGSEIKKVETLVNASEEMAPPIEEHSTNQLNEDNGISEKLNQSYSILEEAYSKFLKYEMATIEAVEEKQYLDAEAIEKYTWRFIGMNGTGFLMSMACIVAVCVIYVIIRNPNVFLLYIPAVICGGRLMGKKRDALLKEQEVAFTNTMDELKKTTLQVANNKINSSKETLNVLPKKYWIPSAVKFIQGMLSQNRVTTLNEALDKCDNQIHQWRLENESNQESAKFKLEETIYKAYIEQL